MSPDGTTITVKIGGAVGVEPERLCAELADYHRAGTRLAVVHGGSHAADSLAARLGTPRQSLTSASGYESRYTDSAMIEVLLAAVAGVVNKRLVQSLQRHGIPAIGLSGVDGGLLRARRKSALKVREAGRIRIVRDDYSGSLERTDAGLLGIIQTAGYVPVIAPQAIGQDGEILNVDADRVAAAVAVALGAGRLVLFTNVPGVLRDVRDPASVIPGIAYEDIDAYLDLAKGRMRTKLAAARHALEHGVPHVIIAEARAEDALRRVLAGSGGTHLTRRAA